jgi:hypothetical protein
MADAQYLRWRLKTRSLALGYGASLDRLKLSGRGFEAASRWTVYPRHRYRGAGQVQQSTRRVRRGSGEDEPVQGMVPESADPGPSPDRPRGRVSIILSSRVWISKPRSGWGVCPRCRHRHHAAELLKESTRRARRGSGEAEAGPGRLDRSLWTWWQSPPRLSADTKGAEVSKFVRVVAYWLLIRRRLRPTYPKPLFLWCALLGSNQRPPD